MTPLTKTDIAELAQAAGAVENESPGDHIYDIREREGLGWDGSRVKKWGAACEVLSRLRKEGKI